MAGTENGFASPPLGWAALVAMVAAGDWLAESGLEEQDDLIPIYHARGARAMVKGSQSARKGEAGGSTGSIKIPTIIIASTSVLWFVPLTLTKASYLFTNKNPAQDELQLSDTR